MSNIVEIRTFKDIQDAIIRRAKLDGNKESVRTDVKEKINTAYQHLSFKKAYRWSGETRPLKLRGRYTTGTIAVTNDSDEITGTGTAWSENEHLHSKIILGSERRPYKIIRVASATEITVDAPYTGDTESSLSYQIFKDEYGLYPDLMNIRKLLIPGSANRRPPLPTGPEELDRHRTNLPFRAGLPEMYTINGYSHYNEKTWATFLINTDFWETSFDDLPQEKNLIVYPGVLTEDIIINMRYTKVVPPMGADSDEPLVPYENRLILVLKPLVENFLQGRDVVIKREWEKEYKMVLSNMESDVETTDDELILHVDRRFNRRRPRGLYDEDTLITD
jgi:hypothetical protein